LTGKAPSIPYLFTKDSLYWTLSTVIGISGTIIGFVILAGIFIIERMIDSYRTISRLNKYNSKLKNRHKQPFLVAFTIFFVFFIVLIVYGLGLIMASIYGFQLIPHIGESAEFDTNVMIDVDNIRLYFISFLQDILTFILVVTVCTAFFSLRIESATPRYEKMFSEYSTVIPKSIRKVSNLFFGEIRKRNQEQNEVRNDPIKLTDDEEVELSFLISYISELEKEKIRNKYFESDAIGPFEEWLFFQE
jgi:hypothetical protein